MYNAVDSDEHGGNEFDKSSLVVGSIDISGIDWFWEVMLGKVMSLDKTLVDAVHSCSTIDRCYGGDIFSMGVLQNGNCYAQTYQFFVSYNYIFHPFGLRRRSLHQGRSPF